MKLTRLFTHRVLRYGPPLMVLGGLGLTACGTAATALHSPQQPSTATESAVTATPAPTAAPQHSLTGAIEFPLYYDTDVPGLPGSPVPHCDANTSGSVSAGDQVTIEDQTGATIGVSQLLNGVPISSIPGVPAPLAGSDQGVEYCSVGFAPVTVPSSSFYRVTIGDMAPVTLSQQQVTGEGWNIVLTSS